MQQQTRKTEPTSTPTTIPTTIHSKHESQHTHKTRPDRQTVQTGGQPDKVQALVAVLCLLGAHVEVATWPDSSGHTSVTAYVGADEATHDDIGLRFIFKGDDVMGVHVRNLPGDADDSWAGVLHPER